MELATKAHMYNKTIKDYKDKHCTEKGKPIKSNLTKSEQLGIKKLKTRQDNGDIVINRSDKSQVTSIMTRENYREQCQHHIGNNDKKTYMERSR